MDPTHHLQLKFITEPEFRKQLFEQPEAALKAVGIEASDDVLSILKDLEKDLDKLGVELGVDPKFP